MTDNDTFQQLQARIGEMEWHHEEKLRKLKADHDELEARVSRPQGDEHSTHTIHKCTQRESHPRQTINTQINHNTSRAHRD